MSKYDPKECHCCGERFEDFGGNALRQSFKNRHWLAEIGDDGQVFECCEQCAQDAEDFVDDEE